MLTYTINGKDYTVSRFVNGVSVLDDDTNEWVDCKFVSRDPEPTFIWKGTTVSLAHPKKITCDEFNELVKSVKGEHWRYNELEDAFVRLVLTEGINSLKFSVPMATGWLLYSRDKTIRKIYHITERQYKIIDSYKIEFECDMPEEGVEKRRSWYLSDFMYELVRGDVTVMKSY